MRCAMVGNLSPVDYLASRLGALSIRNPDGTRTPVSLIEFRTPRPDHAEATAQIAHTVAKAIIDTLADQYAVIPTAELAELQSAAAASEHRRNRALTLQCHCGTNLLTAQARDFNTGHPHVNGPAVITAIHTMTPDCATRHQKLDTGG